MIGAVRHPGLAAVALVLAAAGARAQTPQDLMVRGLRAYRDLDFAGAAGLLRTALAPRQDQSLSSPERTQALIYLGAAELFRGNRDSADAAFERVVLLDPRYLIDDLIFPPEISGRFHVVRGRTPATVVVTPPEGEVVPGRDRYPITVYASAFHQVLAELRTTGGVRVRTLYGGLVGDSLALTWDGRDSSGMAVPSGAYLLVLESRFSSGMAFRYVQVPLEITAERPDTLPDPGPFPDSLRTGAGAGMAPRLLALATGAAGWAAVAWLPRALAPGASPSRTRFVIGGTIGLVGVIGFASGLTGRGDRGHVEAREAAVRAWNERRETVRTENQARRRSTPLHIRPGTPVTVDLRLR